MLIADLLLFCGIFSNFSLLTILEMYIIHVNKLCVYVSPQTELFFQGIKKEYVYPEGKAN